MKIGNLAKGIAFASLWAYAAFVSKGVAHFYEGAIIFVATAAFSVFVIYQFDQESDKK